jgi:hypothetical protein
MLNVEKRKLSSAKIISRRLMAYSVTRTQRQRKAMINPLSWKRCCSSVKDLIKRKIRVKSS